MNINVDQLFKDLAKKNEGKTQSAILFWLSFGLLAIGVNNFVEDARSSYFGLIALEQSFGIQFGSWQLTYWAGSLFFQILTMIGMFIYVTNPKYRWALGLAFIAQTVDFFTDVWYRSNSMVSPAAIAVGFVLTFVYFTVGSELSLTFGLSAVRYSIELI